MRKKYEAGEFKVFGELAVQYMEMAPYFNTPASTRFAVVPAPLNGGAQYSATYKNGKGEEETYAILGIYKLDPSGLPTFDQTDIDTIVHEFAHTFTNSAVTSILAELNESGPLLFNAVKDQMQEQGYGEWQTMIYEAVVRAVVVRFIASHRGDAAAEAEIQQQEKLGFTLTSKLSAVLADYEKSRPTYRSFRDVMPRLVSVFQKASPSAPNTTR